MRHQTTEYLKNRRPAGLGRGLLVLMLSLSLIWVGCLVWIDNSIAIIPDNNPTTFVSLQSVRGFGSVGDFEYKIQSDSDGSNYSSAQQVVRGNGDDDDNREEYFTLMPLVGAIGQSGLRSVSANYNQNRQASFAIFISKGIEPEPQPRPSGFIPRRTAVAYKDFGHLKIMSADGNIANTMFAPFDHKRRLPMYIGRPFLLLFSRRF